MAIQNLLYADSIEIDDKIKVSIPTIGEILDNEEDYYTIVSICTAMPIDYMVLLDELGFDFTEVTEYELFLLLFPCVQNICKKSEEKSNLFLRGTDVSKFVLGRDEEKDEYVYVDTESEIVIDKNMHTRIASAIRYIHGIKKDIRKPANKEAKEYMLDIAKRKAKRKTLKKDKSQIEELIVSMVNSPEFKYDFTSVRQLTIYQFNESVRQVIKRVNYNNYMYGIYSGNISSKDVKTSDLNWLTHS